MGVEIVVVLLCRVRDAKLALEGAVEARFGACSDVKETEPLLRGPSVDGFEIAFPASDR